MAEKFKTIRTKSPASMTATKAKYMPAPILEASSSLVRPVGEQSHDEQVLNFADTQSAVTPPSITNDGITTPHAQVTSRIPAAVLAAMELLPRGPANVPGPGPVQANERPPIPATTIDDGVGRQMDIFFGDPRPSVTPSRASSTHQFEDSPDFRPLPPLGFPTLSARPPPNDIFGRPMYLRGAPPNRQLRGSAQVQASLVDLVPNTPIRPSTAAYPNPNNVDVRRFCPCELEGHPCDQRRREGCPFERVCTNMVSHAWSLSTAGVY